MTPHFCGCQRCSYDATLGGSGSLAVHITRDMDVPDSPRIIRVTGPTSHSAAIKALAMAVLGAVEESMGMDGFTQLQTLVAPDVASNTR